MHGGCNYILNALYNYFYSALPAPTVTLSPYPEVLVNEGDPLSLTCMGSVVEHLGFDPTIEWLYPNGSVITNHGHSSTILHTNISGTDYTSVLNFESFQFSHRGRYQCNVSIDISSLGEPSVTSVKMTLVNITRKLLQCQDNLLCKNC